jgi:hypothetical protein
MTLNFTEIPVSQASVSTQHNISASPETLMRMLSSHYITQAIHVAAKLGIADLLKDCAKSTEEIAVSLNVNDRFLYRLMRVLASVGLFHEVSDSYFETTPLARYLETDFPDSMHSIAIIEGESWHWQSWGNLLNAVKTGNSAFEDKFGITVFKYMDQNPEYLKDFRVALSRYSKISNEAILNSYDFSTVSKLVDIGGGDGSLLDKILRKNSKITCTLFETPQIVESIRQHNIFPETEISERCEMISGDFFSSVPSGADTYILKQIIHNWDDEQVSRILQNCYDAMPKESKLLVIDPIVFSGNDPSHSKLLDLQMLVVNSKALMRTPDELETLFTLTGFKMSKVIPTESPCTIIEVLKQ